MFFEGKKVFVKFHTCPQDYKYIDNVLNYLSQLLYFYGEMMINQQYRYHPVSNKLPSTPSLLWNREPNTIFSHQSDTI